MTAIAPPVVTLLFAAALGLVNMWLAFRAGVLRMKGKALVGDGGDPLMMARMRAHANFNEYVPIALILMALIELVGGRANALWLFGSVLVVARLLHPYGMERPAPNPLRMIGILLTYVVTLGLIGYAVWLLFHPPGSGAAYF